MNQTHNSPTNSSDPSDALATLGTQVRNEQTPSTPMESSSYADRGSRVSKENLFMALALWTERFPATQDELTDPFKVAAMSDTQSDPSKITATSDPQSDSSKVAATSDAQADPFKVAVISDTLSDPSKITATSDPQSDPTEVAATSDEQSDPFKVAAISDTLSDPSKITATSDAQSDPSKVAATSDALADPSKVAATRPDAKSGRFKKVGAVLVLPNDVLYAAECSRDDVHDITRLLMKHHDMAQGCKVFVSRKPCSLCTKLLVQSKVKRVFYLPIEPEFIGIGKETFEADANKAKEKFEAEKSYVDNLFKVSAIGQTTFVPRVEEAVLEASEKKKKTKTPIKTLEKLQKGLYNTYWEETWMARAKDDLPWAAFDENIKEQVEAGFNGLFKWMDTNLRP